MRLRDLTGEITDWNYAGRPVFDRTGISTVFDVSMRFTPDTGIGVRPKAFRAGEVVYPPLAAAIKEQLGLKRVARNMPTLVVVIDHIETTPAAN